MSTAGAVTMILDCGDSYRLIVGILRVIRCQKSQRSGQHVADFHFAASIAAVRAPQSRMADLERGRGSLAAVGTPANDAGLVSASSLDIQHSRRRLEMGKFRE
jgi:hypothetical protein